MTVTLEHSRTGDVAVLHGIDTDAALAHLCRSLVTGSVFDTYRALVVDLDGLEELPDDSRRALAEASDACLQRRQWLGTASGPATIVPAIRRARQWLRLADGEPAGALRVAFSTAVIPLRVGMGLVGGVLSAVGSAASRSGRCR